MADLKIIFFGVSVQIVPEPFFFALQRCIIRKSLKRQGFFVKMQIIIKIEEISFQDL